MKNLKINNKKIKNILKKGIVLTTAVFTLASFSGCYAEQKPNNWPNEYAYIDQQNNEFDNYCKTIIRDETPVKAYKGSAISITIDKATYEIKEYIYNKTNFSIEIYDLTTGNMLVNASYLLYLDADKQNYKNIVNDKYVIDFVDISDYIENEKLKDYYTFEEIKNLEIKILESIKLIESYEESTQKVK